MRAHFDLYMLGCHMAIYEAIESSGPRRRLRLRSPVTLEPIGEFECASAEDVRAALDYAARYLREEGLVAAE